MKFIGTKELETERLLLRKVTINDAEKAFEEWCSKSEVEKYVTWSKHKNVEVTKNLFRIWEEDYKDLSTFRWIVELKDTKEVIGTIDVASKKYLPYGACEIGYCYGPKFWGKKYATEALKKVIKYLFEECEASVVYAEFMHNNPASGEVMKKSGMKYEGRLLKRIIDKDGITNDLLSYSITSEEYFKNK